MSASYENIVLLDGREAEKTIVLLKSQGESSALAYLRRWHEPGESTLMSRPGDPWKAGDSVYEEGNFVMYYNLHRPYIGLVARIAIDTS